MGIFLKNGLIVAEDQTFKGNIRLAEGKIVDLGPDILPEDSDEIIDVTGQYVLPGAIDAHVHYKMPIGRVYTIDNFETGSRAALCGGVTTVIDYAEPVEGLSMVDSLKHRINEAKGHNFVDYSVHMTLSSDTPYDLKDLKEFKRIGINSLKLYTTYGFILGYEEIRTILLAAKEAGMVVTIHSEDNQIVLDAMKELKKQDKTSIKYLSEARPTAAEVHAVKALIKMCEEEDLSVHIVHVSSGITGKLIGEAQKRGVKITAETCPHYLFLNNDLYHGEQPQLYAMQPPLRSEKERQEILDELVAGVFSFVTTDHCAYDYHQKFSGTTFEDTNGGLPGTETLLPLIFSEMFSKGLISIEDVMKLLSLNPAKLYGLYPRKGVLKKGSDADIVVMDPLKEVVINKDLIHTAADYSPFEGFELKGYPVLTILRGKIAFRNGEFFLGDPKGEFIPIA